MAVVVREDVKCLVIIGTLSRMGGAERQALYFVEHLAQVKGYQTEVLTFQDGNAIRPALEALGVPIHVAAYGVGWSRTRRLAALARLALHLRSSLKPDAILPFGTPASKVAGLIWRLSGARFVWWNQQDEGRGLFGTQAERRILTSMPSIVSNSFVGRDFLVAKYGLNPERVHVYNNGTPLPAAALSRGDWRAKVGAGHRKIVAMIANITKFKDHETLIDAWAQVSSHYEDDNKPILVLAGDMNQRALTTSLKVRAFDLGLSANNVRFLGAIDDVPGLLHDSDLVVHSSLTEGCPNAVCEAMAFGRAVIATDIPGCRQALGDAAEEWLVEPKNPAALAETIVTMIDSEDVRRRCGHANRLRIQSDFSVAGMNSFFVRQVELGLAGKD